MNYFNQGFVDAIETLATRIGLIIPREKQTEKDNTSRDLYKLLAAVSLYYRKIKA